MAKLRALAVAGGLLVASLAAGPAVAQKPGGVLQMPDFSCP
jgi:hypothetical protein